MTLYRATIEVRPEEVEPAIAALLEIAPGGFVEERSGFVVYGGAEVVDRLRERFALTVEEVVAGWEDEWRRFHVPVEVGPLWIGPPWLAPSSGKTPVVIDPGRAFGTGAHETTRLCLDLLLRCERGSFLDIGCGSGVLAIAAVKLGFGPVRAIDVDESAIDATRRNAGANGVAIDVDLLDARAAELEPADVAAANVSLRAVEAVASRIETRRLILSGYLVTDRPRIEGWARLDRLEGERFAAELYAPE